MIKYAARAGLILNLLLWSAAGFANDDLVSALEMPNPRLLNSNILTGGQPSRADLTLLKDNGYGLVVNLRTPEEPHEFDEAEEADKLGLTYVQIPVNGSDGVSRENADKLHEVLSQSEGPVLVHCASGNRVGALFALKAFFIDGQTGEMSMTRGREAGLTRLEPLVLKLIEAPAPTEDP